MVAAKVMVGSRPLALIRATPLAALYLTTDLSSYGSPEVWFPQDGRGGRHEGGADLRGDGEQQAAAAISAGWRDRG